MIPVALFTPRRSTANGSVIAESSEPKTPLDRGREAAALTLFAGAVYTALALLSFRADPMQPEVHGGDWVGPVGAGFAFGAAQFLGAVAWGIPLELALFAAPLLKRRASIANVARLAGDVLVACIAAALVHIALPVSTVFGAMPVGGTFGELFGEVLRSLFSTIGSYIIGLTVVGLVLIGRASFSFIAWVERAERGTGFAARTAKSGARALAGAWATARSLERERAERRRELEAPTIDQGNDEAIIAALSDEDIEGVLSPPPVRVAPSNRPPAGALSDATAAGDEGAEGEAPPKKRRRKGENGAAAPGVATDEGGDEANGAGRGKKRRATDAGGEGGEGEQGDSLEEQGAGTSTSTRTRTRTGTRKGSTSTEDAGDEASEGVDLAALAGDAELEGKDAKKKGIKGPTIVDTRGEMATHRGPKATAAVPSPTFHLPATNLLEPAPAKVLDIDREQLHKTAKLLEKTLNDYGVQGLVEEIHPGPTVTTYEVSPQA
ncbi:MAG: DNA translocase FtsK 4TM domain-containing protein, partial [Polyangiaceae bacterium]